MKDVRNCWTCKYQKIDSQHYPCATCFDFSDWALHRDPVPDETTPTQITDPLINGYCGRCRHSFIRSEKFCLGDDSGRRVFCETVSICNSYEPIPGWRYE